MTPVKRAPARSPAQATDATLAEIMAIKALNAGNASPQQQQTALRWILHAACALQGEPYFPASERDTAYMLGRQYVGRQILGLIQADTSTSNRKSETR